MARKNKPVLVVGTGRSGTSAVAKACIDLGVYMGSRWKPEDDNNPGGTWEDQDWNVLNCQRLAGDVDKEKWENTVRFFARIRDDEYKQWGFKDPRTSHFLQEYIELLEPKFVWARRNIVESIASCMRCYNMSLQQASELMLFRDAVLNKYLVGQPVLEVWCGDLNIKELKEFINA